MADLQALEQDLRTRLAELERRLESIKRDVTQEHSADSAEQAQERENDEVVDAIGDETRTAIAAIKKALTRIEDGSYGECASCGADINPERLAVMPEATHCIKCAA
jgi:RNA polymerase-binding protein DksA